MVLRRQHLTNIARHAHEVYPAEACGILVGRIEGAWRVVEKVYRTRNILDEPTRYQIDAEEQYRVFLEAERESLEVLGFYHSHPHWPAHPSEADRAQALYPNLSYVIYSMPRGDVKSYILHGADFQQEDIQVR